MVIVESPTVFPLVLGETGRGRNSVHILQAPRLRDGERLLLVQTSRKYTSSRLSGKIELYGPARVIAEGRWAHGDAGAIAHGPDMLLAVQPGAAIFAIGGDGIGHWTWVRPTGEMISVSSRWRDENPQAVMELLWELTALPDLPPEKGWRKQLAAIEARFG